MAIRDPVQIDDVGDADRLLAVIRDLILELHPHKRGALHVGLDDELDRDLGFDSLGRAELLIRLERAYRVHLPNSLLATAERPGDLLVAIAEATSAGRSAISAEARVPALKPAEAIPTEATTVAQVLDWHVRTHPDRHHLTLWDDAELAITYRELYRDAQSVAAGLLHWGLETEDRVVIMLPTGRDFFHAFFGVMLAGGTPVPIYPPMRMSQLEDHLRRQVGIMRNAEASLLITVPEARTLGAILKGQVESLRAVETLGRLRVEGTDALPLISDPRQTALIQYTSGSTGDPKGVVLTHANLLANIRAMGEAMDAGSADVFVSWLPLYHDMGLIGAWLGCLYFAAPVVIMSPLSFLVRPEQWLWAIHRYRGTLSASPNFGFELCLKRVEDHHIEGLDLSSLRMVVNGAEPVSPQTIRRFTDRFAPYGFRPDAMAPVYGLAESAVGLAFPPPGRLPIVDRVDRQALAADGWAKPVGSEVGDALEFVACGRPLADHEVRIVDALGREVAERREGRLEFRGPSTTAGYYRNETKTRELLNADWLDSGDRAYIAGGDIYITGRIKDIIIRAGRNVYPHEVEEVVGEIEGVRKGCVALFGSTEQASGTERLIVLAETRQTDPQAYDRLRTEIEQTVTDLLGSPADEVVLTPPQTVPKTSSGKIRRSAARALYEEGRIGAPVRALWLQITRLTLAGLTPRLRRTWRAVSEGLYAAYWWTVYIAACTIAWLVVVGLPVPRWRWPVAHRMARITLRLMAIPLTVEGADRLPKVGGVLVTNHASYIDGLVLAAGLPGELMIVVKSELDPQIVAGTFLRRLGAIFVGRFDPERGIEDIQAALLAAQSGRRILVFPEGTLTRMPGLLEFRLGAFLVAAQADVPVVPVTLRGTRSVLRAGQWFPRHAPVSVEVDEPHWPDGHDFAAAVRLRDAVRQVILARVGEPDLVAYRYASEA